MSQSEVGGEGGEGCGLSVPLNLIVQNASGTKGTEVTPRGVIDRWCCILGCLLKRKGGKNKEVHFFFCRIFVLRLVRGLGGM